MIEALLHAARIPFGGELAADFRPVELNLRKRCAGQGAVLRLLGKSKDPLVKAGAFEQGGFPLLERAMNVAVAQAEAFAEGAGGPLGSAGASEPSCGKRAPSLTRAIPEAALKADWKAALRLANWPALKSANR